MVKLYNTLTKKIEDFKPLNSSRVGIYSCGPTVYDYQHIGHMRRYVGDDILVRVLRENGYDVKHIMNITDVGHLVSDSDTGEDKMEKGAKKFGLSVWNIAKKFEKQFFESAQELNIQKPDTIMHATEYIKDQIELIQILEEKGYTYVIADGVYFDSTKFKNYGKLSGQNPSALKAGVRVEMVEGKKHPTDFALWKFSPSTNSGLPKRQMEWESPWGVGFPGWHIECSAMSMRALGPMLDIHTGGIDHIAVHHTNEIAQSEAASGKEFVQYWVHHGFLMVEGQKMSKSIGNIFTVQVVVQKNFDPLALRYLYLQTHYRQEMNFTWEALHAAQTALNRLRNDISLFDKPKIGCAEFEGEFFDALNDDLNTPKALAIMWEMIRSDHPTSAKAESILRMDKILGLSLDTIERKQVQAEQEEIPSEVLALVKEREQLRKQKKFHLADGLRARIKKIGYEVIDKKGETVIKKLE